MNGKGYEPRWYRDSLLTPGTKSFAVRYRETDLWVAVNADAYSPRLEAELLDCIMALRHELEAYAKFDPAFLYSLTPCQPRPEAPGIVRFMAQAAARAQVGPMAAVAGAFCQEAARHLESRFPVTDLIIENGGDIYLRSSAPRRIGIYAGPSPLTGKIALEITPDLSPLGICTSSGTVGHSLSFGHADAVVVLCRDACLADAYATALANRVKTAADIEGVLAFSASLPDILGIVIIIGGRIGLRGNIKLVRAQI